MLKIEHSPISPPEHEYSLKIHLWTMIIVLQKPIHRGQEVQLRLHGTEATILQGDAESSRTAQPEEEEAWGGKGGKTHHSL